MLQLVHNARLFKHEQPRLPASGMIICLLAYEGNLRNEGFDPLRQPQPRETAVRGCSYVIYPQHCAEASARLSSG